MPDRGIGGKFDNAWIR